MLAWNKFDLLGLSRVANFFKTANKFAIKFGKVRDLILEDLNYPLPRKSPVKHNGETLFTRITDGKGLFKVKILTLLKLGSLTI